ncbi:type II secretion system protein GspM [Ferrovibrio sp.]|uniref:type II secretion system protein GspM n=1 Tax=Ferrovibrio sp. TaxID=1917215 RepID=UPI003D0DE1DF
MMTLSLSPMISRFAALGLLFSLMGGVWLLLVDPLLSAWDDRSTAIETTTKQMQAIHRRAQWGDTERRLLEAARQAVDFSPLLIRAGNASQAAAQFQAEVRRRIDSGGAQTRSVQALPPTKTAGGLERLVVRLEGSIGSEKLLPWLQVIEESASPLMLIEMLELRGQEFQVASPGNPVLQFRIDVAGFRRPEP